MSTGAAPVGEPGGTLPVPPAFFLDPAKGGGPRCSKGTTPRVVWTTCETPSTEPRRPRCAPEPWVAPRGADALAGAPWLRPPRRRRAEEGGVTKPPPSCPEAERRGRGGGMTAVPTARTTRGRSSRQDMPWSSTRAPAAPSVPAVLSLGHTSPPAPPEPPNPARHGRVQATSDGRIRRRHGIDVQLDCLG